MAHTWTYAEDTAVIHCDQCRAAVSSVQMALKGLKRTDMDNYDPEPVPAAAYLGRRTLPVPATVSDEAVKANKFYVGHKSTLCRNWGHADLEAAIAHAETLARETGDDQIVVKIVRVVGVKPIPTVVREVR